MQANLDGQDGFGGNDFSAEIPAKDRVEQYVEAAYNPRQHEDNARRNIAYLLIGLLCFVIVFLLAMVACRAVKVTEIKEFAVILGPIVTLVSAATGFYYGTRSTAESG